MLNLLPRTLLVLLFAALAACGGGGSSGGGGTPQTATVGIALTDAPTTDIDQALATITSIELLGDDGRVSLFSGSETVDLLKLADYSELFAVRDDVPAGTYRKIRLQVSELELIRLDDEGAIVETILPTLVANGKIDLNPQGAFYVAPGATLVITIDFDVGKSLKITETGNGKLIVRPVVFVDITEGLPSPGLTRVHGLVSDIAVDNSFRLCQTRLFSVLPADVAASRFGDDGHCIRVHTDGDTGIFAGDGLPQPLADLGAGDEVTVIGRLRPVLSSEIARSDAEEFERFQLLAFVIEEGVPGTFERLRGRVAASVDPGTDRFELALAPGQGIIADSPLAAQLYPKSRIFSPDGVELGRLDVDVDSSALVDAVLALSGANPPVLRTAFLMLDIDAGGTEQVLSGELLSVNAASGQLIVAGLSGDRCVDGRGADVFLISDSGGSLESERGTLADLAPGQRVNVFGQAGTGGCLIAATVLADR